MMDARKVKPLCLLAEYRTSLYTTRVYFLPASHYTHYSIQPVYRIYVTLRADSGLALMYECGRRAFPEMFRKIYLAALYNSRTARARWN